MKQKNFFATYPPNSGFFLWLDAEVLLYLVQLVVEQVDLDVLLDRQFVVRFLAHLCSFLLQIGGDHHSNGRSRCCRSRAVCLRGCCG